MGVKIAKRYSFYKSLTNVLKLVLNFSPIGPHKIALGFLETLRFRFLMIFFRKFQIHYCSPREKSKTSIIWETSDRTARRN